MNVFFNDNSPNHPKSVKKSALHNRINQQELKAQISKDKTQRQTISFYRYISIPQVHEFRDYLYLAFKELGVLGRVYLAEEGINAQISVPVSQLDKFKILLNNIPTLKDLRLNMAIEEPLTSFWVLKIKVRPQIVADGITDPGFSVNKSAPYLQAIQMNQIIEQGKAILVDMRNHYEYEVGHFKGAIEIPANTFKEQLPMAKDMLQGHQDKPIVMYCTGGIRCEKASAYLIHHGFKQVYHLEGGIIHYTRQAQNNGLPNYFKGKNFVFDGRMAERISDDVIAHCHQCQKPSDTHTNCRYDPCHLLFIQCESCAHTMQGCCSQACLEGLTNHTQSNSQGSHFNKDKEALKRLNLLHL